ncbi:hypothetical protein AYO22_00779 [Fonsecaea multimorphosa]|nr:hypothetical protein AYO22_00779 [Fonsecaea multimorphosa]
MGSLGAKNVFDTLPAAFPHATVPEDVNVEDAADWVISRLEHLDTDLLRDDAIWRDSFALTGTLRTFYSNRTITEVWKILTASHGARDFRVIPQTPRVMRLAEDNQWVEARFEFTTTNPATAASGIMTLVPVGDGTWKIWVLRTILEQLAGAGNVDALEPGPNRTKQDITDFDAVVIGGSGAGLATGGRLQALGGVNYVIIEKNAHIGDAWSVRYSSARFHTIREYSHLPFERTFGPEHEEYLGKDAVAEAHRKWAEKYGVLSTKVESGIWNAEKRLYTLKISRNGENSEIRTRHVVMATGAGSETPKIPLIADKELYKGLVLHSVSYKDAKAWKGLSGVVVGSANTAHDVVDDMYEAGMKSVTMVQRSRTYVLPVEYIDVPYKMVYNERIPTEISDRMFMSNAIAVSRLMTSHLFTAKAKAQPERWAALTRAGFNVDPYGDIAEAVNIRLGGHYIDVGTSAKISKGLIKVKSDSPAVRYYEKGLVFADGTQIEADVIIFATGFVGNLKQHAAEIFGQEVAQRAGDTWGLDSEGEVLGAYKPTDQRGLFFLGGGLGYARYYSRYIALSIKADVAGTPLPIYQKHKFVPA